MSLKSKLEAVIYAAEEPVTLAQLTVLFAAEALAWKAEQAANAVEAVQDAPLSLASAASAEPDQEWQALPELAELQELTDSSSENAATSVTADAAPEEPGEAISDATPDVSTAVEATPDPEIEAKRLARLRDREVREILRGLLDELLAEYASAPRGIEIREIAGGYRMATKPECHDAVRTFVKSLKPPLKLSLPALETLAVIAYKQPVTAPEVADIRGVDSAGVLGSLISRKLITTAGRKSVVGRPMLYKTTKEFLLRFGLKDVSELPSMEEFEKMAAIELSDIADSESEEEMFADESGNLFADADAQQEPTASNLIIGKVVISTPTTEPVTATAEPSKEAAEAQAPVERQDVVEIEANV